MARLADIYEIYGLIAAAILNLNHVMPHRRLTPPTTPTRLPGSLPDREPSASSIRIFLSCRYASLSEIAEMRQPAGRIRLNPRPKQVERLTTLTRTHGIPPFFFPVRVTLRA